MWAHVRLHDGARIEGPQGSDKLMTNQHEDMKLNTVGLIKISGKNQAFEVSNAIEILMKLQFTAVLSFVCFCKARFVVAFKEESAEKLEANIYEFPTLVDESVLACVVGWADEHEQHGEQMLEFRWIDGREDAPPVDGSVTRH